MALVTWVTVTSQRGRGRQDAGRMKKSSKPNIVFILTDDQDELLGKVIEMWATSHKKGP